MSEHSEIAMESVPVQALKLRDSNLELFRIIAMLLIIAHHFVVNSGLMAAEGPIYKDPFSWRSLFLMVFGAWGKIGINCFVMITGYFMCTSNINAKKFMKLLFEAMFYRLIIYLIFWITGYEAFTVTGFLRVMIPIRNISNDFLNAFLLFYLLIPFLNILVQHLREKQHVFLILWCGFTYIFLGTVPGFSVRMNYVSWFCVLFVIASYIRLYPKKEYQNHKIWVRLTIVSVLLCVISVIACAWLSAKTNRMLAFRFVSDSNTFLAVVTGVCLFMLFKNFKNLNIGYGKFINMVASSTFGVLLIHANSDTMRRWLWEDVIDAVGHYNAPLMPLYAVGCVAAIYVVCMLIDQLRIKLIEKPFFNLWDRHWDDFLAWYKKLETKVFAKMKVQE
ncbi:MAG: acyltransferase [Lachnospiraceae bacterium]|nr:acyltransferase [Lachnospiraceae bacterium]